MDGNGRMGRLLITLILCAEGYLPQPLLYLSAYLEQHRDEYLNQLLRVSQIGAWEEWISLFLRGVAEQARDAMPRSQHLIELQHTYRNALQLPTLVLVSECYGYLWGWKVCFPSRVSSVRARSCAPPLLCVSDAWRVLHDEGGFG
ncbi:MAG: filamentation induced by cAMP protein Fic [Chloroflexi bacterium]|nr:filamentation induced by cAMP protein Fic [Chloroflexota bacterium]